VNSSHIQKVGHLTQLQCCLAAEAWVAAQEGMADRADAEAAQQSAEPSPSPQLQSGTPADPQGSASTSQVSKQQIVATAPHVCAKSTS